MTRYIEQFNETTDPVSGDYLWLVDASAPADDKDRKINWDRIVATGTWTPDLQIGGGTTGITYSFRDGRYVKLADKVALVWFDITLSSKGSLTGNVTIAGLPLSPSRTAPLTLSFWNNTNLSTVVPNGRIDSGGTTVVLSKATGGAAAQMQDTDITNTSRIIGQAIVYM